MEIRKTEIFLSYGVIPQKLALTSPTGGGRSVGMVRSRTKATEFSLVYGYRHTQNMNNLLLFHIKNGYASILRLYLCCSSCIL